MRRLHSAHVWCSVWWHEPRARKRARERTLPPEHIQSLARGGTL
jgi:hypothetical protein